MKTYNLIVIGGGAGGLVAAAGAASLRASVALIDKAKLGGDCLWTGCVPTKSLIYSAKVVHMAKKASLFGMQVTDKPQFEIAKRRMDQAIAAIQKHDDPERFKALGIDVYEGSARFEGSHVVRIGSDLMIYGKRIVISTGSRPFIPPIKGLEEAGFLTNETALQLTEQPESLVVVGGGPIGLEFAQSFARFGTKVTVVEMASEILMKEDPEMVPYVKSALENEGIIFHTGAKLVEVKVLEEKKHLLIEKDGQLMTIHAEEILIASGRTPNVDNLQLEKAGVKAEKGYIPVNGQLQSNVPHIYAVGDVNGTFPFTHAAGMEGKTVVSNAVLGLKRKVEYRNLPWVTFTDPEIFHLGLTEKEARKQVGEVKVYRSSLEEVDRFVADHETSGMIKIITDRKGRILGAHAVGQGAGDIMQEVVFAKHYGHKIGAISHVIHPYPTHVGGVQRVADLYWRQKLFSGWLPKIIKTYIRWFR